MSETAYIKLGDCCTKIGSGATPKGGKNVYIENGVALIRSQNVHNASFNYEGLAHINDDAARKLKGVTVQENDLLLNITGDSVARVCQVPPDCLPARVNQHVAIIRPDKEIFNPRFLLYYLVSPYMQSFMLNRATGKGASRNAITKEMIGDFVIPCPKLDIQNRLCEILFPFDKLIENNHKQIMLLEEEARRFYKDWFIDLNFPGHEAVPIVDGLPDRWRKIRLGDFIEGHIGGGWGEEVSSLESLVPAYVIRATDIADINIGQINLPYRWHKESNYKSRLLKKGDIVFEVSGGSKEIGVGRSMLVSDYFLNSLTSGVICASFCKRIQPRTSSDSYLLYQQIQHDLNSGNIRRFEKRSAGNIINFLWDEFLYSYMVLVPDENTYLKAISLLTPIRDRIEALKLECHNLYEARDRLISKLMLGEIEVS